MIGSMDTAMRSNNFSMFFKNTKIVKTNDDSAAQDKTQESDKITTGQNSNTRVS